MRSKRLFGAVSLVIVGIIFGALLVSGFGLVRPGMADINIGSAAPPVNLDADANSFSKAFIEVAEKVTPAIVQIKVVSKRSSQGGEDLLFPFFDQMPENQEGSGSGIIISADGYILTNNHVVENATNVDVGLFDKRSLSAKVIGTDPLTDLAVIKIDATDLPVAYLGDSDNLKVGQWVMAIGNPLALSSTVTAGIVSAIGRGQLNLIRDRYGVENFIQTDAAINPGNSGGALVDLSGAVIGVNSAIAAGRTGTYIGYGFAIPINMAKSVAKDLIAHGKISRGYIGVSIDNVDYPLAKSLGLDKPRGVIIQDIVAGGSAANADVKKGDVILKIDGKEVNAPNELQSMIASRSAGTKVNLTLYRDGKEVERSVTLKARDEDADAKPVADSDTDNESKDNSTVSTVSFDNLGLSVQNLSSKDKSDFKIDSGIKISDVKDYSKAYDQRLRPGLVILEADKKKVHNVSEFKKIIESKKGSAILLKVQDGSNNSVFIGIEIPE
jgi:serine protease Do